ncbi:MAG: hypothetical protein Ta2G_07990 [Termitinemataceae bacterium]|nr:MAG: hypothetical protein Ta2G_07990 [Termitinemataceae bacterium]
MKKLSLLLVLFCLVVNFVCAQKLNDKHIKSVASVVKGRLIKATLGGKDTTHLYEPILNVIRNEILGVKYLSIELEGARVNNSKRYDFYNDGSDPLVWKRRMLNVGVSPLQVRITTEDAQNNLSNILIMYEYRGAHGYGSVSYLIAVEK